ncbi:MAG: OmpA family protein [Paludibacteraceae bacterium]|nr:OmpA family protein [Paludibacteraceae bacterium]
MKKAFIVAFAAIIAVAGTSCKTKQLKEEIAANQQAISKIQYEQQRQAEELKKLADSSNDSIDGVAIKDIISGQQYQIEQINKQLTKTRKDLYKHLNESGSLDNAAQGGNFKLGSAELSSDAKAILDKIAESEKSTDSKIAIVGHTDNTGSDAVNNKLSQKRADAAKDYLVKKGIAEDRISAQGAGSGKPVVCNDDAASRAKNRRIEVSVSTAAAE